ncbi:amidoligase family protein [Rhodohalobacter sp. 614A]|uniref:amidoligase family protein n=1 Tax=Rhodohalobacter sp. 614A TaxID=2908649 RepID=UPI001F2C4EDA|nr:amidoligase family protein [Rhodohalobacter sp. 614A]
MKQEFLKPPKTTNSEGKERSAGFEFEFTGVEMDDVAAMISELYGGEVKQLSTYEFSIERTRFGDFGLELDAQLIREKKYEKFLETIGIDISTAKNQETFEDSLMELASSIVPYEIITPPVPLSQIMELTRMVDELRNRKAKGTGSSFVYAFGLHINPEIPDNSTQSILNHLRAFVLFEPWIRKQANIDVSRRLTPFINRYENDYIQHILNPGYQPDQAQFIKDYFDYGNNRNRPLDMQPLFMFLDEELTAGFLEDTLTSARPTFHYRLPNCSLEDETWTMAAEWNRWVLAERLAADEDKLHQLSSEYLKMWSETMIRFEAKWLERIGEWAEDVW